MTWPTQPSVWDKIHFRIASALHFAGENRSGFSGRAVLDISSHRVCVPASHLPTGQRGGELGMAGLPGGEVVGMRID